MRNKPKKHAVISLMLWIALLLMPMSFAYAADPQPVNTANSGTASASGADTATGSISNIIRQVGDPTKLPNYDTGHAKQNYQPGASQFTSIVYYSLDYFKYVFGAIAVFMMTISGIRLIIAGRGVQDTLTKEKEVLRLTISGFVIVLIAEQFIANVFFGSEGEMYRSGEEILMAAEQGAGMAMGIAGVMRVFIPATAILYMVLAGIKVLFSQGNPEAMTKAKTQVAWSIIGIILAGVVELVIFRILFPDNGARLPDTAEYLKFILTVTNYVSAFITTIAVSMLIYAGYLYVVSAGGEGATKAKTVIMGAVIGLVIAMAAYALVNTVIKLEPVTNVPIAEEVEIPNT